jgi:HD-like signal output (HDOD) protein
MTLSLERNQLDLTLRANPKTHSGAECRRDVRVAQIGRATIVPFATRCPISVKLRDLSTRGVGLLHTQALRRGDRFLLLMPESAVSAKKAVVASVVYCRPTPAGEYEIGAEFTEVLAMGAVPGPSNHLDSPAIQSTPTSAAEQPGVQGTGPRPEAPKTPSFAPSVAPASTGAKSASPGGASTELPVLMDRKACIERAEKALAARTLSGAVAQVIAMAASPRTDMSELATLIGRDGMLSARIIQTSNSARYMSSRGRVSNIPEAVRHIGCAGVRDIAASVGVFDAMPPCGADGFNPIRCWQHSFAVATICQKLAAAELGGQAYLVGLCHDLGQILFQTHFAAEYRQVLAAQAATGKPRDRVEREMLGMRQGDLAISILRCLKLPDAILTPIDKFHNTKPGRLPEDPLGRILRIADLYANGVLLVSAPDSPINPLTRTECETSLGSDAPPSPDAESLRGEVFMLTSMLARLSNGQDAELMAAPYPHRSVRIWLARDPALSPFDPVCTALSSMADVTVAETLPRPGQLEGHAGLVVLARTPATPGFTAQDIAGAMAGTQMPAPVRVLWLVGQAVEGAPVEGSAVSPISWPVPLKQVAEFVEGLVVAPAS